VPAIAFVNNVLDGCKTLTERIQFRGHLISSGIPAYITVISRVLRVAVSWVPHNSKLFCDTAAHGSN
jgi:hypothetical protein